MFYYDDVSHYKVGLGASRRVEGGGNLNLDVFTLKFDDPKYIAMKDNGISLYQDSYGWIKVTKYLEVLFKKSIDKYLPKLKEVNKQFRFDQVFGCKMV